MKKIYILSITGILILFNTSCKKFEIVTKTVYTNSEVSNITENSATVSTEILEVGENLRNYGFCYGTTENPTIDDNKTENTGKTATTGIYTELITELVPNTKYYVRTYSDDDIEIKYHYNEQTFTTLLLTVTTDKVTNIAYTTATCGGNVTDGGSKAVTARGVCWSTSQNPDINDEYTTNGSETGAFTSNITDLTINTTYYVRAYATNSAGTKYGDERNFTTLTAPSTVNDIDGNTYNTVIIGNQMWTKEDLRVTHYPNGDAIPHATDNTVWENLENNNTDDAYCFYDNNSGTDYGALYTYAAAIGDNWVRDNSDGQGVCPDGWHLPSEAEWEELNGFLGWGNAAGGKMKETGTSHWNSPNTGATNESGFTALPGGHCGDNGFSFSKLGEIGYFWSADEYTAIHAIIMMLKYDDSVLEGTASLKSNGYSVRCLRD